MKHSLKDELFRVLDFKKVIIERLSKFPNLVGYYELEPPYEKNALEKTLAPFLECFEQRLSQCILFSSLTDFSAHREFWDTRDREIYKTVNSKKWFREHLTSEQTESDFVECSMLNINRREIECLCELVFRGHTSGYAFFFWLEENLVVYPHSKYGFGFVAEPGSIGENFSRGLLGTLNQEFFLVEIF